MSAINFPASVPDRPNQPTIFLAGSIEDDRAGVIEDVKNNILFFNPRRAGWNHEAPKSQIIEQIEWELKALEIASAIFIYFQPGTKSQTSLLEFGLFANKGKVVVCCPLGFWQHSDVFITCKRYGVQVYDDFQEALVQVQHLACENFDRIR